MKSMYNRDAGSRVHYNIDRRSCLTLPANSALGAGSFLFGGTMMRTLTSRNGDQVIVDDDDADLALLKWYIEKRGYATRGDTETKKTIYLHRVIGKRIFGQLGIMQIDHIDRNTRDNRRANLRLATHSENLVNSKKRRDGKTSRFKGVSWFKPTNSWRAYINVNRKQIGLGYFDDEIEAAKAYDDAAKVVYGEFVNPNLE